MSEVINKVKDSLQENLKFDGDLPPDELNKISEELNEIARTLEMVAYWARTRAHAQIKRGEGKPDIGAQLELNCFKVYETLPDYAKF